MDGKYLPYPKETLAVLARGTDFAGARPVNHAIHANKEMIADKAEELMAEWNLKYLFIATEDENYYEYFKGRFGNRAFFTEQKRYTTRPGEWLAEMHRNNPNKPEGWQLGADYILAVYLLSKCHSFLASGSCGGVGEARKMNNGLWKHEYVFELGRYQ